MIGPIGLNSTQGDGIRDSRPSQMLYHLQMNLSSHSRKKFVDTPCSLYVSGNVIVIEVTSMLMTYGDRNGLETHSGGHITFSN